jgi:hypothetical protein
MLEFPSVTVSMLALTLVSCTSAPAPVPIEERLHGLRVETERADDRPLDAAENDLLVGAQVDVDRFAPRDLRSLVALVRFGRTLTDADVAAVIAFGTSEQGIGVAWPLTFVLLQRGAFDGAAVLLVASGAKRPRDNRAYATWKWVEYGFGHRDDFEEVGRQLSLALLRCHDSGSAPDREVVADLFGARALTPDDVSKLRHEIETPK